MSKLFYIRFVLLLKYYLVRKCSREKKIIDIEMKKLPVKKMEITITRTFPALKYLPICTDYENYTWVLSVISIITVTSFNSRRAIKLVF